MGYLCRLLYPQTKDEEKIDLREVKCADFRLEDAQQAAGPLLAPHPAAGSHDDPEPAAGVLSGPNQAAGLLPDMPPPAPASTAQVAKAGPGAVGAPLPAPALPAHTLVAPSLQAVTTTAASTKVQHALVLLFLRATLPTLFKRPP